MLDPTAGHINYFPDHYKTDLSIDAFCRMFSERYLCTDDDPAVCGQTLSVLWDRKRAQLGTAHCIDARDARTLHSYTVECRLYKEVNAAMRTACLRRLKSAAFKPHLDYIYHLDRALRSAITLPSHVTTLYRGIKRKVCRAHYAPGNTVTWHAFSSTSERLDVALEFAGPKGSGKCPGGTVFVIKGAKSAKGIFDWSQYPEEAEWLFGFNSQFVVADPPVAEAEVARQRDAVRSLGDWDVSLVDFILLFEV